ncbi:glycerophosphodiester phosphodiesterase [Piscirickettsia litoralis]|uniref:Glycerophosphodiester phosphodiesterase n=1 Tax=Piscirickettsia litoralis TaxID=1891921 RepID=A0ABX2ZZZ9_9GAMM|nr:glycerophosphodiester phosphodiesterase [Piscirickettsia litoralis]ODN41808.1 glycerophosphodiester phosphodiesterase [Piscirickettsia litoralis]
MSTLLALTLTSFALNTHALEIYGHRGARGLSPENTIPAYNTALRLGVNYVDMDITMTKDGVLVVSHDLTLNPNITRNHKGLWIPAKKPPFINTLTLKQVQSYDVGAIKPGTNYSKLFSEQYPVAHTQIPTLKHVIEYVKAIAGDQVGFQIEIKTDPAQRNASATPKQFATALAKLLKEEKITNRTEVQAFDWPCLIALQKINPNIKTAYLTEDDSRAQMMSDNPKIAGLWTGGYLLKNYDNSIPKMIHALGGKLWDPEDRELTQQSLQQAHKLGLKVVVWSDPVATGKAFDAKMMEKMISWGVDGIITDRPDELRGLIAARGFNLPSNFSINSKSPHKATQA